MGEGTRATGSIITDLDCQISLEQIWYDVLRIHEGKHVSSLVEIGRSVYCL